MHLAAPVHPVSADKPAVNIAAVQDLPAAVRVRSEAAAAPAAVVQACSGAAAAPAAVVQACSGVAAPVTVSRIQGHHTAWTLHNSDRTSLHLQLLIRTVHKTLLISFQINDLIFYFVSV